MKSKLSSKGQLIIPKTVRRILDLRSGSQFNVKVHNRKIILEPVQKDSAWDSLFGKYAGTDLLGPLEKEHKKETNNDLILRS